MTNPTEDTPTPANQYTFPDGVTIDFGNHEPQEVLDDYAKYVKFHQSVTDLPKTYPTGRDDKQLEEILKMPLLGCDIQEMADAIKAYAATAQLQLVSELEGEASALKENPYGMGYDEGFRDCFEQTTAVLKHKKQELEGLK